MYKKLTIINNSNRQHILTASSISDNGTDLSQTALMLLQILHDQY